MPLLGVFHCKQNFHFPPLRRLYLPHGQLVALPAPHKTAQLHYYSIGLSILLQSIEGLVTSQNRGIFRAISHYLFVAAKLHAAVVVFVLHPSPLEGSFLSRLLFDGGRSKQRFVLLAVVDAFVDNVHHPFPVYLLPQHFLGPSLGVIKEVSARVVCGGLIEFCYQ